MPELEDWKKTTEEPSSTEDEFYFDEEMKMIDFEILPDKEMVNVGEYSISFEEFAYFTNYVLEGGMSGWVKGEPMYVTKAINALGKSKNQLFDE